MKQKKNTMKKTHRASTRRGQFLKEQSVPLKSEDSNFSKILVIVGIAIVIILGILLYNLGTVGKAVQETPSLEKVNLDIEPFLDINIDNVIDNVQQSIISVTASDKDAVFQAYTLDLTKNDDGTFSYTLKDESDTIVAKELFSAEVGGGEIYFLGDELPDLIVSYNELYFRLVKANYQEPEAVGIIVLDKEGGEVSSPFLDVVDGKAHFVFNATSSIAPTLMATWVDATPLGEDVFKVTSPIGGDLFTQATLDWTQDQDGAYPFVVNGSVGDKSTAKRYVLSVGGVLYNISQTDLPWMMIKKVDDNTIAVSYTFAESANLQPFSLPCGKLNLEDKNIPADVLAEVDKIYSYEEKWGVQQWQDKTPSNFKELESNKGYFLQRRTSKGELSFTVQCKSSNGILPPDATPSFSLPALKKGWNLIGISGYEPITVGKLKNSLPPYTAITQLYSITLKGVDTMSLVTELQPGRAYWVRVQ